MLYEIHMLKNYPSTNLNRDDTGAPKTCVFGGVTRGRISSQCLKRSWRKYNCFQEEIGASNLGIRTRYLPDLVGEELLKRGIDEAQYSSYRKAVSEIAKNTSQAKDDDAAVSSEVDQNAKNALIHQTKQIIFYAPEDIQRVANAVEDMVRAGIKKPSKSDFLEKMKDASICPITLDIALFGRMVTSDAFRNVEAAMQVAHAVSTHRIVLESDYFTAMDDMLIDRTGSALIDATDYNSACYYIYASIDSDTLKDNLRFGEKPELLVQKAIPALLQTMAWSNPTGKQNSFAGHVLPSAVLVECKEKKVPVSYVNAFVEPAYATQKRDLVAASAEKLVQECDMIARNFGVPVSKRLWFCVDKYAITPPQQAISCDTFGALVEEVANTLG